MSARREPVAPSLSVRVANEPLDQRGVLQKWVNRYGRIYHQTVRLRDELQAPGLGELRYLEAQMRCELAELLTRDQEGASA